MNDLNLGEMIVTIGIWVALSWIGIPMMWAGLTAITGVALTSAFLSS